MCVRMRERGLKLRLKRNLTMKESFINQRQIHGRLSSVVQLGNDIGYLDGVPGIDLALLSTIHSRLSVSVCKGSQVFNSY